MKRRPKKANRRIEEKRPLPPEVLADALHGSEIGKGGKLIRATPVGKRS